jgi:glucose/mannose-6-phosphate isomerase
MQPDILDDKAATAKIDRQNMLGVLEETPKAYEQAYSAAQKSETLPRALGRPPSRLMMVGMGGSAIAGDIIKDWLFDSAVSIEVVRRAQLPGTVDKDACVLVASYSGRTAETLSALKEVRRRRSKVCCVASDGELLAVCRKKHIPFVRVRGGLQPRMALPHLASASLAILERWKVCDRRKVRVELERAVRDLAELEKRICLAASRPENQAKQLAVQLLGTVPCVYASPRLASVGRRFKNQLNENAKVMAKFEVLPEMLHNEVEAWRMLNDEKLAGLLSFIFLREREDEAEAFKELADLVRKAGVRNVSEVFLKSPTLLASLLSTVHFCDYVSFYLAIAGRVDPTPINTIQTLKLQNISLSV